MRHVLFALWFTISLAPTMRAQPKVPDLSYDADAPLHLTQTEIKSFEHETLLDVSFDSPRGGRVNAYVVMSNRLRIPAGIVWQNWGQGDRSSMLPEAIEMARRGAVSILINAPTNRPEPGPNDGLAMWLQDVVDVRRAVDVLIRDYRVPVAHVGYVGHGYGATLGGLVAVAERRFRALVLMGGVASLSDATRNSNSPPVEFHRVDRELSLIDAVRYIDSAAPAALFFQFARFDRFIRPEQAQRYFNAASSPKLVRWYDCGHEFNDPASATDRENWLALQLELTGSR